VTVSFTTNSEDMDEIHDLLTMLSCPYLRGTGQCVSGCRDEPACQTDGPYEDRVISALHLLDTLVAERDDSKARLELVGQAVEDFSSAANTRHDVFGLLQAIRVALYAQVGITPQKEEG
jgi:hypothetical protein